MNLAEVQAELKDAERAFDSTGYVDFRIQIRSDWICAGMWRGHDYLCGTGSTIPEAIAELKKKLPKPEEKARELREQARKLLREAVELEVANGGAR